MSMVGGNRPDYSTKDGALILMEMIAARWTGKAVNFRVESIRNNVNIEYYCVRSDLVNGLPRGEAPTR